MAEAGSRFSHRRAGKLHSRRTDGALPSIVFLHIVAGQGRGPNTGVIIQVNETGPLLETRQAISQALLLEASARMS